MLSFHTVQVSLSTSHTQNTLQKGASIPVTVSAKEKIEGMFSSVDVLEKSNIFGDAEAWATDASDMLNRMESLSRGLDGNFYNSQSDRSNLVEAFKEMAPKTSVKVEDLITSPKENIASIVGGYADLKPTTKLNLGVGIDTLTMPQPSDGSIQDLSSTETASSSRSAISKYTDSQLANNSGAAYSKPSTVSNSLNLNGSLNLNNASTLKDISSGRSAMLSYMR